MTGIKKNRLFFSTAIALAMLCTSSIVQAVNPYERPDQADITISGEVISQTGRLFTLDYGEGLITVEMDDFDMVNEAEMVNPGERVTVYGEIDNDLFEKRTIEAGTVYVNNRSTYYFANEADEEFSAHYTVSIADPELASEGTRFGISGIVKNIDGTELTVDNGFNDIRIETAYLDYNPLDDVGYQQIDKGDKIYVSGNLDRNFFTKNEIDAEILITLEDNS